MKRGYFGDIVTGPFVSFGVETSNQDMFKKANNMYVNMSLDIATYNLQQLIGKLNLHKQIIETSENVSESESFSDQYLKNVSIKFVYGKDLHYFLSKGKFKQFFDTIFLASDAAQFLNESILTILKPKSEVIVLKKEQIASILETL